MDRGNAPQCTREDVPPGSCKCPWNHVARRGKHPRVEPWMFCQVPRVLRMRQRKDGTQVISTCHHLVGHLTVRNAWDSAFAQTRKVLTFASRKFRVLMGYKWGFMIDLQMTAAAVQWEDASLRCASSRSGEKSRLSVSANAMVSSVPCPASGRTKILCGSYGEQFAKDFALRTRELLRSADYQAIFPDTSLEMGGTALDHLRTTVTGYRHDTSVRRVVTSSGANYIFLTCAIVVFGNAMLKRPACVRLVPESRVPSRLGKWAPG
ncbi:MAG: hypothetical protein JWM36_252 [Hyphomicrobiales bacterium]|nr:hypothetical protein [Hyphomicrobiales bacterium]